MEIIPRVCYLYHKAYSEDFMGEYDYTPIIKDFGDILFRVDDDYYSGDSYILYGDISGEGQFGFLNFGWGSCSGCDALQACSTWEEVQELYDELKSNVIWFKNIGQACEWFYDHDWEGDYSTAAKKKFVKIATAILETLME